VTEQMLSNMFIGKPPGNYDRILDFSTALTGNLFFLPSLDLLEGGFDDLAGEAQAPEPASTPDDEPMAAVDMTNDGSLGIGTLRASSE
jgi:putative iron-dependent peroxidase